MKERGHMELRLSQNQRLEQKQILAPLQQQSLKLLQIPTFELLQEIRQELEENPCLEAEELTTGNESLDEIAEKEHEESQADDVNLEEGLANYLKEQWENSARNKPSKPDEEIYQAPLTSHQTLSDHLMEQLRCTFEPESDSYRIGEFIIYNLNQYGLLELPLADIVTQMKVKKELIEEVRETIKNFDPIGIGAYSHQELFITQARAAKIYDSTVEALLNTYYDDFLNKRFHILLQKLNLSNEQLEEYIEKLQLHLDPKPARQFTHFNPQYVRPDLKVYKNDQGEWEVQLINDSLPNLRVNSFYSDLLQKGNLKTDNEKQYLSKYLQRARWYIKNIFRRQETIYRVADAILHRQKDYFDKGSAHLNPLVLKDIADELGYHETTISRTVNNKYMDTPYGIIELRKFFSKAIETDSGEDSSANAIKSMIKDLIKSENPQKPLSDQKLTHLLNGKGIRIARRTVAKYRESSGILPTHLRKKLPKR